MERKFAVVGVLDLLGFSNDLMSAEEDSSHLLGKKLIFDGIKMMSEEIIREKGKAKATIKWASDTCIAYCPLQVSDLSEITKDELYAKTTEGLFHVSTALGIIQCFFACEEFFSRGGIAFGTLIESKDSEPFGTGLVRASDIIKSVSDDPSISVTGLLSSQALGLKVECNNRNMYLLSLPLPFLDYLSFAEIIDSWGVVHIPLTAHARHICRFVEAAYADRTLSSKASFLLAYHNWHIKSRGNLENLLVKLQSPSDYYTNKYPEDNAGEIRA